MARTQDSENLANFKDGPLFPATKPSCAFSLVLVVSGARSMAFDRPEIRVLRIAANAFAPPSAFSIILQSPVGRNPTCLPANVYYLVDGSEHRCAWLILS